MTLPHHFCPFKSYQRNPPSGSGEAQEMEELQFEHLLRASQPERKGPDNLTWILASHPLSSSASSSPEQRRSRERCVLPWCLWLRRLHGRHHAHATFSKGLPFSGTSIHWQGQAGK